MEALKTLGQAAHKGKYSFLSKALEERLDPMKDGTCQKVCRPHFWCYYRAPEEQFR